MDIFGIGPTELVFIILIALILLGPKEMEKTGRTIGRFLRDMARSESWRAFRDTSRELRNLPNRLMREANIEDLEKDIGTIGKDVSKIGKEIEESASVKGFGTWANPAANKPKPPQSRPQPAEASENQITPPKSTTHSVIETDKEPDNDA
jgi:sec-independent protein translocase protein TatB